MSQNLVGCAERQILVVGLIGLLYVIGSPDLGFQEQRQGWPFEAVSVYGQPQTIGLGLETGPKMSSQLSQMGQDWQYKAGGARPGICPVRRAERWCVAWRLAWIVPPAPVTRFVHYLWPYCRLGDLNS